MGGEEDGRKGEGGGDIGDRDYLQLVRQDKVP